MKWVLRDLTTYRRKWELCKVIVDTLFSWVFLSNRLVFLVGEERKPFVPGVVKLRAVEEDFEEWVT